MSVIYCLVNEFDTISRIYYNDGEEQRLVEEVNVASLGSVLPQVCNEFHTNELHLFGNTSYLNGIVEEIQNDEMCNYSENKLKIEVN